MPSETEREARERRERRAKEQYITGTGHTAAFVGGAEYEAPIARQAERAAIVADLRALANKVEAGTRVESLLAQLAVGLTSASLIKLAGRYEAGAHTEEE